MRRAETWCRLGAAAGYQVVEVTLRQPGRSLAASAYTRLTPREVPALAAELGAVATGRAVPEALIWSGSGLRAHLDTLAPEVVVTQTARAHREQIVDGPWVTVIDLVDRLSRSYRQRAHLGRGVGARLLPLLAASHDRFERHLIRPGSPAGIPVVTAGQAEAAALGVRWIPNLVEVDPPPPAGSGSEPPSCWPSRQPHDAVFFGSLDYLPNIEALRWLARGQAQAGPGVPPFRLLVAGRRPTPEVAALAVDRGWTLRPDYPSGTWLVTQARVAIAPLRSTAGIQNKVLEAAVWGLPQVVTPAAMAGVGLDFPARVVDGPAELARAVRSLADHERAAHDLSVRARAHVAQHFTVDAWVDTFERLVAGARRPGSEPVSPRPRVTP